jgi:hypothetical protein
VSSHVDPVASFRRLPWLVVALAVSTLIGCSLFPADDAVSKVESRRPALPPIRVAQTAIQLEVLFVERPADDPLLGPILWREIDQIAAIPAETRELLQQNGFRVGHVGSSLPPTVQTLLGIMGKDDIGDSSNTKPLIGSRKILPPGMDTEVQTGEERESCQLNIVQGDRVKRQEYQFARSLFRMKSARLQDGWVRIDFQPEIHHGENRVRHTPTEEGWAYRSRQNVDARHAHQFSLTMNVGEMAIITAAPDQPDSMGDLFFCRDDNGIKKQRVLIVRVADAGAK